MIYKSQEKIHTLQNQINLHFLYNTLDCIRGQALMNNEAEIAYMLESLSSLCRYSIQRDDSVVRLKEELKNLENYISIQNYRFNNKISYDVCLPEDMDEIGECCIPKLCLQPLVENCILHGLLNSEMGEIRVIINATEKLLWITISDNGCGIEEEKLNNLNKKINMSDNGIANESGKSLALTNIQCRIRSIFGEMYGLHMYSIKGMGTDVEIMLPRIENITL